MKDNINDAISVLCNQIADDTNALDNKMRADTILALTMSAIFTQRFIYGEDNADEDKLNEKLCEQKIPKPGEHFSYHSIEFVALGEEQGGILAVTAEPLEDKMPFDKNRSNYWRKSTLRKFLNEEYIKKFNRGDLLPFVSDLTSDDGMKDYGTSEDFIALLSDNLYKKYRENFPKYGTCVWSITPHSCLPSLSYAERVVNTDGSFSYAINGLGVAPACIFNPAIFDIAPH